VTRIAPASVEEVRQAVDIVDLVRGHTELRRSGKEWRGRCPFHEERTASFWVDPVDKVYHCFGCGRGGDAVAFARETQGLDFPGAIEWLAERYGVRLVYEESSPRDERRRAERGRLLELLATSADYYARYLWAAAEAEPARAYVARRGISEETARAFRLGFAPTAWDRVVRAAVARGFSHDELLRAGLAVPGRRGPVDRFRARLLFPLADARGQVRGFGARQMPGGPEPKYLNSPEGPLFSKSDLLYALDRARRAIAARGEAVVVEGYTDALALHQAGLDHVVAAMGTALTARQVGELRRLCRRLVLAFDADVAGEGAALRGIELALGAGLDVRVASLPAGRDPADVVLEDAGALERALAAAEGFLAYRVRRALSEGESRDRAYERVRAILAAAPASLEREEQVRLVADRLSLTDDLTAALTGRHDAREAAPRVARRARLSPRARDERLFLGMCLALPEAGLARLGELDVEHFSETPHREAAAHIRRRLGGEATSQEGHDWASTVAELKASAAQAGISEGALQELFLKLHLRRVEDGLKNLGSPADFNMSQERERTRLQQLRLSILEAIRAQAPQD
jgi:DNA primase